MPRDSACCICCGTTDPRGTQHFWLGGEASCIVILPICQGCRGTSGFCHVTVRTLAFVRLDINEHTMKSTKNAVLQSTSSLLARAGFRSQLTSPMPSSACAASILLPYKPHARRISFAHEGTTFYHVEGSAGDTDNSFTIRAATKYSHRIRTSCSP
jgi:hypothetical protein